jgi:cytochrome c oxidase assembly protein subunit 15
LAYVVVGLIGLLAYKSRKFNLDKGQKNGIYTVLTVVFIQFSLGVFTLLFGVPIWLGLAHQIGAFVLLASLTFTLHRLSK